MLYLSKRVNTLKQRVEEENLERRKTIWKEPNNHTLDDFPLLDEEDLRNITCGVYQLKLSTSYIQEHLQGNCQILIHKEDEHLIRVKLQSRHASSKTYILWIEYTSAEITAWYCKCRAGARVVGVCAHIASILWYLGYARHNQDISYGVQAFCCDSKRKKAVNMFLSALVVVVTTSLVLVQCHDCKDYDLSASDQSFLMKHYLRTTRKEEGISTGKPVASGVTYVRWGKKGCPKGVDMVYTGQVGGNNHGSKAGGVNYLCLPNDPENGESQKDDNAQLFGSEYEIGSSYTPSGMKADMQQKEVPCAVCFQRRRSVHLMIPGRKTCYKGWTSEYSGFLMTDHKNHSSKDYLCVDKDAEPLDNKTSNENEALLYGIRTKCGSLRCPPYKDATDVRCVVCTK